MPLLYVAQQLGHSKPTITLKYYARWIPSGNANHVGALDKITGGVYPAASMKRGFA
ncbi:MAG: hypothetical protein HXY51_13745 [Nitrospirae bacterium]|nr:hypothetical protein [Nitrospirota bacterium]